MGGKQHSSAPDQTLELIVRLQSFKILILRAEKGQVAVQSESLLSLEGNKKVKDRHQGHRKKSAFNQHQQYSLYICWSSASN